MSPPPWSPGPRQPDLAPGAVHVWRAALAPVDAGLQALLSAAELERAARILPARKRALWMSSRAILRALLARYLGDGAVELLHATDGEKPRLADPHAWLSFSLSHSGETAIYAFARDAAVGVDVERTDRRFDERRLAARLLPPAVRTQVEHLDPASRRAELLARWTRREAAGKLDGGGFAGGGGSAAHLTRLELGAGAVAALATRLPVAELCLWELVL